MLDRYSISAQKDKVTERFSVEVPDHYKPRFNAGPSQLLPVITNTGSQGISFFYWGIAPEWAKNKTISEKIINIKAETITEKAMMRKKLSSYRCIIPGDGFFAWKKIGKKTSVPYRFILKSKDIFGMAGLWEEYEGENGENYHTFAMITVPSNELTLTVSERMPAMLDEKNEKMWLESGSTESDLINALAPYSASKMDCYSVSPRIASLTDDDQTLVMPSAPADQHGNLTLFD